jgi:hypothetical protein
MFRVFIILNSPKLTFETVSSKLLSQLVLRNISVNQ